MRKYSDNFQDYEENNECKIALMSRVGDREDQQDCAGFICDDNSCMVVVCDGMGGHQGGRTASALATDMLISQYEQNKNAEYIPDFFISSSQYIDGEVAKLKDSSGNVMMAGSTMVSAIVRNKCLYWLSVGDSRLYILRNNELVQATEDHVYASVLEEKKRSGLISQDEYEKEMKQGEALVSFLGINGLPKISVNEAPFMLLEGDIVVLMSDGLYKVVPDEEIKSILLNFSNIEDALNALEMKARSIAKRNYISRDNMTVAIIKIKEGATI